MSSTKSVLIFGATGYIGGAVLVSLKSTFPSFSYTTTTRSEKSVDLLTEAGTTPVVVTSREKDRIVDLVAKADIVINAADSDDLQLILAILEGSKKYHEEHKGSKPILVHISGVANFIIPSDGSAVPDAKTWTDDDKDNKLITPELVHGKVDTSVFSAIQDNYVDAYIVSPATIYGIGPGPGLKTSLLPRFLVQYFVKEGAAFVVGEGSNHLRSIHIQDVANLIELIVRKAISSQSSSPSPYSRYYIATADNSTYKEWASLTARSLHDLGRLPTTDIRSVTAEEAGPFGFFLAADLYVKGDRAKREFGWEPKGPSLAESVHADTLEALKTL